MIWFTCARALSCLPVCLEVLDIGQSSVTTLATSDITSRQSVSRYCLLFPCFPLLLTARLVFVLRTSALHFGERLQAPERR
ncbi:hypothetical protein F5Y09DRAFT_49592 [Xylaria sp. FL1042]|nr:hypothetical protein F5Y09DRAFT_49592 [Xylaria sp. FL1042]